MPFAWNFRHPLLFFSALARRCKGWHSLIARFLTLRRVSPFLYYRLNQLPSLTHPTTPPTTSAWAVPGGNPSQHLGKTEGGDFRASWQWKGWATSWGGGSKPVVTQQAVATHRALVLVVADVLDGSDVDDVDALLLSRQTGVLLVHPHSCLLWSFTEIFWQKIHPMKLAVCVWEGREQFYQDTLISTCSSQSHPKAETYPVPALSCQWALGQGSHPFSLPPFSAFLSPLQPYLGLLLLQRKRAQLTFILHGCLRRFLLCGLMEWLYFLAREGKRGWGGRERLLVRIGAMVPFPFQEAFPPLTCSW